MSSADLDPRRLDLAAFARAGGTTRGRWSVRSLPRLLESTMPEALAADAEVHWSAAGDSREPLGRPAEVWLRLEARTSVPLECQRCLTPIEMPVSVDRRILFVEGEEVAAELDAEQEEDVLAMPRLLDLQVLVEDELLLALPLVPRHEVCPTPLPMAAADPEIDAAPHPFEALAALKRDRPLN